MPAQKHIIIFSHGFGVLKDSNGLFSDIEKALPEMNSILFDYSDINNDNTITIYSLSAQAAKLNFIIDKTKLENPNAIIDLICCSQGSIIAALAKPEGIRKTIFISPVFNFNLERTLTRHRARPNAVINLEGISRVPSVDGLIRIIPAEY